MTPQRFHKLLTINLCEYKAHRFHIKANAHNATHDISIVHEFLDFIYDQHLVGSIEQITVSIGCSKFHVRYKKRDREVVSLEMTVLKGYFVFLNEKSGIKNEKLMRGAGR
jgi:hypothetical protein